MSWEKIKSNKIFSNKFITLFDEKVIAPTGIKVDYGRIHFHRKAASVCVVDFDEQKILFTGQYRYPLNKYSYETIQGGGDLNDDPEKIAIRELREEAKLDSKKLNLFCETNTSNSVTDEKAFLFWCNKKDTISYLTKIVDPTELIETKWINFNTCLKMIENHEITDALTQISIFFILNNISNKKINT